MAICVIARVGQNPMYTVYIRYFWQGNYQIYGHIRCIYTVLANPSNSLCATTGVCEIHCIHNHWRSMRLLVIHTCLTVYAFSSDTFVCTDCFLCMNGFTLTLNKACIVQCCILSRKRAHTQIHTTHTSTHSTHTQNTHTCAHAGKGGCRGARQAGLSQTAADG
jgi:hypothetical protein